MQCGYDSKQRWAEVKETNNNDNGNNCCSADSKKPHHRYGL